MTLVYLVLYLALSAVIIIGLRDIGRYLWFRAQEAVFDQDISNAYRSGNNELAVAIMRDRQFWLKYHPCPRMTWLGMPMVILVMAAASLVLVIFGTVLYIWDTRFDAKSAAAVGPYRQVR